MSAPPGSAGDAFSANQLVVHQQASSSASGGQLTTTTSNALDETRSSNLKAPTMKLSGHTGEVYATRFDHSGNMIASASFDRSILLWRTYGDCENFGELKGHKGSVLDLQWSRDDKTIYSSSSDMTVASWDLETGKRIRRHEGHTEYINSITTSRRGQELIISGSNDNHIGIWDPRRKKAIDFLEAPAELCVTCVAVAEAGNEIYSSGIGEDILVWDIRQKAIVYSLVGHTDTVTSLEVSPDSQSLLSFAFDNTVRTWDIRPFAPTERALQVYDGAVAGIERNMVRASWDPTGKKIAAGSGDGTAIVWNVETKKMLHKLPGHRADVNDVRFCPNGEPIILTGSTDKEIFLGELGKTQTQERNAEKRRKRDAKKARKAARAQAAVVAGEGSGEAGASLAAQGIEGLSVK